MLGGRLRLVLRAGDVDHQRRAISVAAETERGHRLRRCVPVPPLHRAKLRHDRDLGERQQGDGQPLLELHGDDERLHPRPAVLGRCDVLAIESQPGRRIRPLHASNELSDWGRHAKPVSVFVTVPGTVVAQGPCVNQRSWRAWLSWAPLVVAWAAAPALAQRAAPAAPAATRTNECATPRPGWIWCDDFEQDRLKQYFEYEDADGAFARAAGVGVDGSYGMRVRFTQRQLLAGALRRCVVKGLAVHCGPGACG